MEKLMVKVVSFMLTETYTLDRGKKIKLMVSAFTLIRMAPDTRVTGKMTSSMEMVLRLGRTKHLTRETTLMERSKEQASSPGLMAAHTKVRSWTITLRASVATSGRTIVYSRETGRAIKCTAMVFSPGPMVVRMKASTLTTKKKAKVLLPGPTTDSMWELGLMASRMVLALTQLQLASKSKVNGRKESVLHGFELFLFVSLNLDLILLSPPYKTIIKQTGSTFKDVFSSNTLDILPPSLQQVATQKSYCTR
jgi:hypothetical protein